MISALATGYLFLGGAGSGALFMLCGMELLRTMRASLPALPVFSQEMLRRAWAACLLFLTLGVVFLLFDLGNFEAVIFLLLNPQPTALTIGAFTLPVAIICAATFLALEAIDGLPASVWMVRALSAVGLIVGMVVMGYTGILLQDMAAVLAWQTPLVPLLFVLSSLSCGAALVLGSIVFVESRAPLVELISWLLRFDSIVIVVEALLLGLFIAMHLQDQGCTAAMLAWINGALAPVFWVGLVALGLVIPFVLEQFVTFSSYRHQLLFIAAAVLVGGLALRICVVGLAGYDPAQAIASVNYNQYVLSTG